MDSQEHRDRTTGRRVLVLIWVLVLLAIAAVVTFEIHNSSSRASGRSPDGTSTIPSSTAPVVVHIKIVNNSQTGGEFEPRAARVIGNRNYSIQVTNASDAVHTVTDRNGAFNTGDIARGHSVTFRVSAPRLYHYYDIHHPAMTGTINVLLRREPRKHP